MTAATNLPDHPDVREDYTLVLVAATALHVGAPSDDGVTDLPLATDGRGRLLVPGTSWAGVLRASASRHLDAELVKSIFGYGNDKDVDAKGDGNGKGDRHGKGGGDGKRGKNGEDDGHAS